MANQYKSYPETTLLPKDTTIVDGTLYYKHVDDTSNVYEGPFTLTQLETEYGIAVGTISETYSSFEEIEYTDMSFTTGLNSVTYGENDSWLKFNVLYPNQDIKTIIFRFTFGTPAILA
jgi:hypothetical protein